MKVDWIRFGTPVTALLRLRTSTALAVPSTTRSGIWSRLAGLVRGWGVHPEPRIHVTIQCVSLPRYTQPGKLHA